MPWKNPAFAQTAQGVRAFEQYCVEMHGYPSVTVTAPDELKLHAFDRDEITMR